MAGGSRRIRKTTGELVVARLEVADRFWSRLLGLQFRRSLPLDAGLLVTPCRAIHTCFLRFAIDAIFLDTDDRVLAVRRNVKPWRFVFGPSQAHSVLETPAGAIELQPGETLRVE